MKASSLGRILGLILGSGLSFGFIGAVFGIAWESFFSLPAGTLEQDYVTLGRRVAESNRFAHVSSLDFADIRAATPEVEWSYADESLDQAQLLDSAGVAHTVEARRVSSNFLSLLGVGAMSGRVASNGGAPAAVVSAEMHGRLFGSDSEVDATIASADANLVVPVIGVADAAFKGVFNRRADVWILAPRTAPFQPELLIVMATLRMFGVLPEGLAFPALESLVAEHRFAIAEQRNDRAELVRGLELHPDARRALQQRLVWLALIVVLLLALAFMGFVDFLAADLAVNAQSHAIRLALGATPLDVLRESAAKHGKYGLAIAGASLASYAYIADTLLGMEPFAQAIGELGPVASVAGIGTSMMLLVTAFLWSCGVVGRAVSRRALTFDPAMAGAARRSSLAWMTLLFAAAASLLLTLSMLLQYVTAPTSGLGFANHDALMVGAWYPEGPTPEGSRRIRDALSRDASVVQAARAEMLPLLSETVGPKNRLKAAGDRGVDDLTFFRNRVDAEFFDVLGVDLLAGRLLDGTTKNEMVMSRTAAQRFGRGIDGVVGMGIEFASEDSSRDGDVFAVVGIVEDVPYDRLEDPPRPVVYTALREADPTQRFQDLWLIRHQGVADDIVELFQQLDGGIEDGYRIGTPASILRDQFARRSVELVLAMAGAFAFLLSLAGVANALMRAVSDQARHIGIRYALGATRADESRRIATKAIGDLIVVGGILSALVVAGRFLAPGLLSIVTLPLVLAVIAALAGVCAIGSYASVRRVMGSTAAALAGR